MRGLKLSSLQALQRGRLNLQGFWVQLSLEIVGGRGSCCNNGRRKRGEQVKTFGFQWTLGAQQGESYQLDWWRFLQEIRICQGGGMTLMEIFDFRGAPMLIGWQVK